MPPASETPPAARRAWTSGGSRASGVGLVVGLVVLGCCLGGFAVWFQWQQTRRCLGFYGPEVAAAISLAPRVELWELEPAGSATRFRVVRRTDASRAAGLVHLRRGLVEDGNFNWSPPTPGDRPAAADWRIAISFLPAGAAVAPTAVIALAIDPQGRGTATVPGRPGRVTLGRIGKGLRTWIEATLAADGKPADDTTGRRPEGRPTSAKDR